MKLKVMLVGINSKYVHSNLAIRYLRAYTRDLDFDCIIREFSINDRIEKILEEIMKEKPHMIAFSCYIWNIEMVKGLSKLIKLIDEKIEIIYGGPEVSFNGREFLEKNKGEYLIEGEGEETFKKLIEYKIYDWNNKNCNFKEGIYSNEEINHSNVDKFCKNTEMLIVNKQTTILQEKISLDSIKGLFYKNNEKVFYNGTKDNIDINNVVFPYTEEDNLDNKIVYYEGSRGCPFGCKYCLSSVDRNVRMRDVEKVKSELKFLIDKKVRLVKFVDRTFNCSEKFSIEIWKFLIEQNTETKFHFEVSANILTNDQIEVLSKAPKGRFQFEVGVQTTNDKILRNINRYVNFKDIAEKVEEIKKLKNISQHLDLIAGLPGEDFQSFKKSFNEVYSMKPEEIQLGFLKILKGSPMMLEKDKWGIVYSPYPPYEVLKTKDISYDELIILKKIEAMVDKYYNSGKFSTILKYFELKFSEPFDFYYSLGKFFDESGYFDRNISSPDYYRVFLEFNSDKLKDNNDALREIVKYDYLMFNRKRWLPEFLIRDTDKKMINNIKEKLYSTNKIKCINIDKNKIHIEKFTMNVLHFIQNHEISFKTLYLAYDEDKFDIVEDITNLINL